MMGQLKASNTSAGFSLVELLIAMLLGLTLTLGVIEIYVGSATTEHTQEARLRIQENARFALSFMGNEMRMAGYLGCLSSMEGAAANNTLDGPPNTLQPETGVQGWEADGTAPGEISNSVADVGTIPSTNSEWSTSAAGAGFVMPAVQAVPNSDIVRIWGAIGNPGQVTDVDNSGSAPVIEVEGAAGIQDDDILIISDCEQVDIVQACSISGNPASTADITLSTGCSPGNSSTAHVGSRAPAEVVRLEGVLYYVGKRGNVASNPPTLFRVPLASNGTLGTPEELIEGVESMQLLYGVNVDQDLRATVDAYVTADNVTDWDEVISIRMSLLLLSPEDGTVPEPRPYTFNGVSYSGGGGNGSLPPDDRIRRVFTNTISLRNRALGT